MAACTWWIKAIYRVAMQNNTQIEELIKQIAKLPGIGPKSAKRLAISMLQNPQQLMLPLSDILKEVAQNVRQCEVCGNVDTISPCNICSDIKRDSSVLCVVETLGDLWAFENASAYRGLYHVLQGNLSAIEGRTPDNINLKSLHRRVNDGVTEVIIATSATLEGETTGHYINDMLKDCKAKITRLAHGIPVGAEIDYMDEGTINIALQLRQAM
jgi:recombination protein RecR